MYRNEEQDRNYYQNRELKLLYLKKMIDLVQLMLNEELTVKPSKIVAGHDPESTNQFLQAIYRAAVSGQSSDANVKSVNAKYDALMSSNQTEEKKEQPPAKEERKEPSQPKKEEKRPPNSKGRERPQEKPAPPSKQPQKEKPQTPNSRKELNPNETSSSFRPGSAIKKPPKIKSNVTENPNQGNFQGGGVKVIKDGEREKEFDEFDVGGGAKNINISQDDPSKHGKFVRDVMESQAKEQPNAPEQQSEDNSNKIKMKSNLGRKNKIASGKEFSSLTDSSGKTDLEGVKTLVQGLCQSTNPIGKVIELMNEDVDSMNKEMEYWRKQYLTAKLKFSSEQKSTEDSLQPLQDQLAEVEERIRDQRSKIQSAKSALIRNSSTIQQLLTSVVSSNARVK